MITLLKVGTIQLLTKSGFNDFLKESRFKYVHPDITPDKFHSDLPIAPTEECFLISLPMEKHDLSSISFHLGNFGLRPANSLELLAFISQHAQHISHFPIWAVGSIYECELTQKQYILNVDHSERGLIVSPRGLPWIGRTNILGIVQN